MKTILILIGHYVPGYKDGGPVRSIKNLTDRLGDEYNFRILTIDREATDTKPYDGIKVREYNRVGKADVYYVEPGGMNRRTIEELAKDADLVYMCGCFSEYAIPALSANWLGHIPCPFVIASMGLFTPGAFRIKYAKKKIYMTVLRVIGFFKHVEWSATDEIEAADIRRQVGKNAICHLAEDLPRKPENITHTTLSDTGNLRVIFLSRISKKKNLLFAVKILQRVTEGNIVFDIYGNKEDAGYWQECEDELNKLPENVIWSYKGIANAEDVVNIFSGYDVFLFPTMAENYGHVIFEAMAGGCVPIISDRTPWDREKMHGCGISIELGNGEKELLCFSEEIKKYCARSKSEKQENANRCIHFVHAYGMDKAENRYRQILNR